MILRERDQVASVLHESQVRVAQDSIALAELSERLTIAERKISEMSTRDAMLDQKDADIRALVAKVEARMRRRESQEASAILNRKAMSDATPSANRR